MDIIPRWRWLLQKISRELWLTTVIYSIGAFLIVLLAPHLQYFIPNTMNEIIRFDAVKQLLNVLASSMLAVTTFSLTTMVSANNSVKTSTSPRASRLILNDTITRNALGSFLGSFLFSLIGIISLDADLYGEKGHIILFFCTLLVVVIIIGMFLRWINYLMNLGEVSKVSEIVEYETQKALQQYASHPCFGCRPLDTQGEMSIPKSANNIYTEQIGYIQHIDLPSLKFHAKTLKEDIYILALPGDFVNNSQPIAKYTGTVNKDTEESIRSIFTIANQRSYDYDPRFGLIVLSEIASRALSPGINDSGTAIDIISRTNRVLYQYFMDIQKKLADKKEEKDDDKEAYPKNIWMRTLEVTDLLELSFLRIARDGYEKIEIHTQLQSSYASLLSAMPDKLKLPIKNISEQSFSYIEKGKMVEKEIIKIKEMVSHFQ